MKTKQYKTVRFNRLPLSFIVQKKAMAIMLLLLAVLCIMIVVSLGSGAISIHPMRVLSALFGNGTDSENFTIFNLRMPRILLGILVGIGLAFSGAILQGIIRNPLAAPDVIGVNSGAALMAVFFIAILSDHLSIYYLPLFAFFGALAASFLMYILAWKNGVSPFRLILIGFGLTAMMGAVQTILMVFGPIWRTSQSYVWMTGSLHATNWHEVQIVSIWFLFLIPLLFLLVMPLNLQSIGDQITTGLGGRLQMHRLLLIALAACFAGVSVAFAGGIGFIGLMAPHIARKLVGASFGQLLPCSALIGALIVVFSDWVGRTWFTPLDVPVGVFTALIGAPFFIYLFVRFRKS